MTIRWNPPSRPTKCLSVGTYSSGPTTATTCCQRVAEGQDSSGRLHLAPQIRKLKINEAACYVDTRDCFHATPAFRLNGNNNKIVCVRREVGTFTNIVYKCNARCMCKGILFTFLIMLVEDRANFALNPRPRRFTKFNQQYIVNKQ